MRSFAFFWGLGLFTLLHQATARDHDARTKENIKTLRNIVYHNAPYDPESMIIIGHRSVLHVCRIAYLQLPCFSPCDS